MTYLKLSEEAALLEIRKALKVMRIEELSPNDKSIARLENKLLSEIMDLDLTQSQRSVAYEAAIDVCVDLLHNMIHDMSVVVTRTISVN